MWKILFHLVAAVQFFYGCYYDYTYVQIPSSSARVTPFGGKFKYLTYLNAMVQTLYFAIALFNDLIGTNEPTPAEKPLVRHIKDIVFSTLAFPLSMFVGLSFWGIYAVDRELILPQSMDPYFPTWLNHVMHTNIVVFILIDLVLSFRMYPRRNVGLTILTTFMALYMIWLHYIYFHTGSWVYPILKVLNWPLRVFFYLFSLGLGWGMYTLGETVNRSVWSKEIERTVKAGKKKAK